MPQGEWLPRDTRGPGGERFTFSRTYFPNETMIPSPLARTSSASAVPPHSRTEQEKPENLIPDFVAGAPEKSWKAFGAVTAAGPAVKLLATKWLPSSAPAFAPAFVLTQGLLFARVRSTPQEVAFGDRTAWQKRMTDILAFSPFVVTFTLQAHFQANNSFPRVAQTVSEGWAAFCKALPGAIRAQAANYPIHFVLARLLAQFSGAMAGALISSAYMSRDGVPLERRPIDGRHPRPSMTHGTVGATFALFSVPAAMSTETGMKILTRNFGKVGAAGIVVTAVVGAMGGVSHIIHQQDAEPVKGSRLSNTWNHGPSSVEIEEVKPSTPMPTAKPSLPVVQDADPETPRTSDATSPASAIPGTSFNAPAGSTQTKQEL